MCEETSKGLRPNSFATDCSVSIIQEPIMFLEDENSLNSNVSVCFPDVMRSFSMNRTLSKDEQILESYVNGKLTSADKEAARNRPSIHQVTPEVEQNEPKVYKAKLLRAIRKRKLVTDPIANLLRSGNLQLLTDSIEAGAIKLKKGEVLKLLKLRHTKVVLEYLKKNPWHSSSTHPLLKGFDSIAETCKLFEEVLHIPDAIQLFIQIGQEDVEPMHIEQIIYSLNLLLYASSDNPSELPTAANPLSICVVLSDFIDRIMFYNSHYTFELEELCRALVNVAECIKHEVKDIRALNDIYFDKPFGTYTVIEYLVRNSNKYRRLLNYPLTKQVALKSWTGNLKLSLNFKECSYISKVGELYRSHKKLWRVHCKTLTPKSTSLFQLQSWIKNCNIRHYVETLSTICFAALLVHVLTTYINSIKLIEHPLDLSNYELQGINQDIDQIEIIWSNYFLLFSILNGVQSLIKLWYKHQMGFLSISDPRLPFDLVILISALVFRCRLFGDYDYQDKDRRNYYEFVWAVFTFCYIMRVFLCFSIDSKFGPILRMLFSTFIDTCRLLLVFLAIMLCFAVTSYNLFYESIGYRSIEETLITLFSASLGTFDFYTFVKRAVLGRAFLSIWIVVSTILILNILIAVIGKRYERLATLAQADFVSLMLIYIQTTAFTPEYGGLVVFPLPLTLLCIPFLPLYLLPINKVKLSSFLAKISYCPMMVVAVVCFLIYNLGLGLVTYVKLVVLLMHERWKSNAKSTSVLLWVVAGPVYLAFLSMRSLPVFLMNLFAKEIPEAESIFTENDIKKTISILTKRQLDLPTVEAITIHEALSLFKLAPLNRRYRDFEDVIMSEVNLVQLRLNCALDSKKFRSKQAYQYLIMKLANYPSKTLNLKEAILLLQEKPLVELKTYSRYFTEKALAKLLKGL